MATGRSLEKERRTLQNQINKYKSNPVKLRNAEQNMVTFMKTNDIKK